MTESTKNILYVVFLPQEWEIYHRRPYWEAMAEHAEILLVEPPAGILTGWYKPKRLRDVFRGLKQNSSFKNTIHSFRPYQLLSPGFDFLFPVFSVVDRILMRHQLKKVLKKLNNQKQSVVSFIVHVHQKHFSKLLGDARQCYEITDLYTIPHGHHELDEDHWYTVRARKFEIQIVDDSELVITSSKLVYENLKTNHNNIHYMSNAADHAHFANSTVESLVIPDDIKQLPKPVIGFIGYINHLIDFELIEKLAEKFKNASIVLIGGVQKISNVTDDTYYQKSLKLKNVHYMGFKKYETLPSYLKAFDVCLMPFRLNDWMKHSAPNKTYQYLASGKPIVSTDFTEVRQFADIIYVAKSHDEFIAMVEKGLGERDEPLKSKRQQIAKENSTEKRAIKLIQLVEELC